MQMARNGGAPGRGNMRRTHLIGWVCVGDWQKWCLCSVFKTKQLHIMQVTNPCFVLILGGLCWWRQTPRVAAGRACAVGVSVLQAGMHGKVYPSGDSDVVVTRLVSCPAVGAFPWAGFEQACPMNGLLHRRNVGTVLGCGNLALHIPCSTGAPTGWAPWPPYPPCPSSLLCGASRSKHNILGVRFTTALLAVEF